MHTFPIQTSKLTQFYQTNFLILGILIFIFPIIRLLDCLFDHCRTFPVFSIFMLFLSIPYGLWCNHVAKKVPHRFKYWVDNNTLYINQGLIDHDQIAIPLPNITSIMLSQGILMRRYGLYKLQINTNSRSVHSMVLLMGLKSPEAVRDTLLNLINTPQNEHEKH